MQAGLDQELKVGSLDIPVDLLAVVVQEPRQRRDVDAGREGLGAHCGKVRVVISGRIK